MNKYNRTKVPLDGYSFASKLEASVYSILRSMANKDEISDLRCQETIYLTNARIIYKPDFSFNFDGQKKFAEAKGFETPEWRIKRRLWQHYGPGPLEIWKGTYQRPYVSEVLIPIDC